MELWTPLQPAIRNENAFYKSIFDKTFKNKENSGSVWMNNLYTVVMYDEDPNVIWLSIKRNDREPIVDWRHFQWIKNQLVGNENEAAQLFPAESRLVDGSNQYHLWVVKDPKFRFPFGFTEGRQITRTPIPGGKQKGWPKNMLPVDIEEQERLQREQLKKLQGK